MLDRVRQEVADDVHKAQHELLAVMRRKTTLDDESLVTVLSPFGEAAFNAGYRMGALEAEALQVARLRLYRPLSLIATAAAVASWLILLWR